jgi:hypothetical protein
LLLAAEPIDTFGEALDVLWMYDRRWHIQEFDKAWKSDTRVEALRARFTVYIERAAVKLMFVVSGFCGCRNWLVCRYRVPRCLSPPYPKPPRDEILSETEWILYSTTT